MECGAPGSWAFFAGVDVTATEVTCCVAGAHRVHLIKGDSIVESTREHTLANDPGALSQLATDVRRRHANMVVRSLGAGGHSPAELTRWSIEGPCDIVVVSADYYHYREPLTYALAVKDALAASEPIQGSCAWLSRH